MKNALFCLTETQKQLVQMQNPECYQFNDSYISEAAYCKSPKDERVFSKNGHHTRETMLRNCRSHSSWPLTACYKDHINSVGAFKSDP